MRTLGVALGLALTLSCAPAARPPPSAAPTIQEPALVLPADLDLVLRLDLKRVRAALGIEADALLRRLGESAPSDEPDADTGRLLLALLTRADTAWIAVRPGLSPELTDGVIALRGDFHEALPTSLGGAPRWSGGRDLGGGLFRFDREPPRVRAAPAVIYVRVPDIAIIGSEAEIDALERTVEKGALDPSLRAPEVGLVAVAARLGSLRTKLASRAPTLAQYVEGAERLEGSLDRAGETFRVRLDVHFESEAQASKLCSELRTLQEKLHGEGHVWVDKFVFEPLGEELSVRLDLSVRELAALVRTFSKS